MPPGREAVVRLGPVPNAPRLREAPAQRAAARPKTALWARPEVLERRELSAEEARLLEEFKREQEKH